MTRNPLKRLYHWILSWADHPGGTWALFFLSFAESSIFPVPPDVLLIALILGRKEKAWWYAAVCTVGSLLGAAVGYLIGWGLWATTGEFWLTSVFSQDVFTRVQELYKEYEALAVFGAAFTPIPFKVFTIAAGVFKVNFVVFLLAALVGRGGRFFLVSLIMYWIGPKAKPFIDRWFNWLALAFLALGILGFWVLGHL